MSLSRLTSGLFANLKGTRRIILVSLTKSHGQQRRYGEQADRYRKAEDELKKVQETICVQNERSRRISAFISEVETMPETVTEFSPDCWGHLVDRVTVYSKDRITFTFTTGMEV